MTIDSTPADPILASLVDIINSSNAGEGPGITLTLGGFAVSGVLISNVNWFKANEELAAAAAREVTADGEKNGWNIFFSGYGDSLQRSMEDRKKAEALLDQLPEGYQRLILDSSKVGFIHLKNAQIFTPGQSPIPTSGMFWRGRIEEVSGWTFGSFGFAGN